MSKFFEALERADREQAPEMPARRPPSSARAAGRVAAGRATALGTSGFDPPAMATALDRSNRVRSTS